MSSVLGVEHAVAVEVLTRIQDAVAVGVLTGVQDAVAVDIFSRLQHAVGSNHAHAVDILGVEHAVGSMAVTVAASAEVACSGEAVVESSSEALSRNGRERV